MERAGSASRDKLATHGVPPRRRRLDEAVGACRGAFAAVVLFSFCISLLVLTVPLYMLHVFEHVLASRSIETLLLLTGIALFALSVFGLLEAVRNRVLIGVGTWLDQHLGPTVFEESVRAVPRDGRPSSAQGLRDLATLRAFLTGPAVVSLLDSPWMPAFVVIIYILHPLLGWLSLGGALILLALGVANELMTRPLLERANLESINVVANAEAAMRNAGVVEAMGMMPALAARWMRDNAAIVGLQARASATTGMIAAGSKAARFAVQIGLLASGAWLAIQGEISPGVMIAASILMTRALAPVEQAIGSYRIMEAARAAYRRLDRQLRAAPTRGTAIALPEPHGRISVEGVLFAHSGSKEPILCGISIALRPGESLGLIGPLGSGKTTLARLLVGDLRPSAGRVRIDGADVAEWDSDDRGRYVGYLPQDVGLFPGTVRANIARMEENPSASVIQAAKFADVHELILSLPQGYETEIVEGGSNLSGGWRQRLGLARALYGRPRLVVLDEPNANLDAAGEDALLRVIDRLRTRGITTVIISHRPNMLRRVDRVLLLRDGRIDMLGPRDEILSPVVPPDLARAVRAAEGRRHG